jgi:hypothetical protein
MSLAAGAHLAEGLQLTALLTLKVKNSLCLVGTRLSSTRDVIIVYFAFENINEKL